MGITVLSCLPHTSISSTAAEAAARRAALLRMESMQNCEVHYAARAVALWWLLLGSGVVGLGAWVASVEGIWCDGGSAGPTGSREEFPPSWLHWTCSTSPA